MFSFLFIFSPLLYGCNVNNSSNILERRAAPASIPSASQDAPSSDLCTTVMNRSTMIGNNDNNHVKKLLSSYGNPIQDKCKSVLQIFQEPHENGNYVMYMIADRHTFKTILGGLLFLAQSDPNKVKSIAELLEIPNQNNLSSFKLESVNGRKHLIDRLCKVADHPDKFIIEKFKNIIRSDIGQATIVFLRNYIHTNPNIGNIEDIEDVIEWLQGYYNKYNKEKLEIMYCPWYDGHSCDQPCFGQHKAIEHLLSHITKDTMLCLWHNGALCGELYFEQEALKQHLLSHIDVKPSEINLYHPCKWHECNEKTFINETYLDKHVQDKHVAKSDVPHTCYWDNCGKKFKNRHGLKNHTRIHTGEKIYRCINCSQSFTQKGNFNRHMHIHTRKKLFKCAYCKYASARVDSFKKHVRSMHRGKKSFKCAYCKYASSRVGIFKKHICQMHT